MTAGAIVHHQDVMRPAAACPLESDIASVVVNDEQIDAIGKAAAQRRGLALRLVTQLHQGERFGSDRRHHRSRIAPDREGDAPSAFDKGLGQREAARHVPRADSGRSIATKKSEGPLHCSFTGHWRGSR